MAEERTIKVMVDSYRDIFEYLGSLEGSSQKTGGARYYCLRGGGMVSVSESEGEMIASTNVPNITSNKLEAISQGN